MSNYQKHYKLNTNMATYKTAGLGTYTLAGSISSTATSITLSSFTVPITGTDVTMSSLGTSTAYGTLSPGTADAEFISFTGITQNSNGTATLTGVTRGLNKETPYTTSSSFKRPHTGQALFILSNSPNVYDQFPAKVNDETITGKWTFPNDSNTPLIGASYVAPTADTQVATKKYVDDVAISGAPDASTTTKGIVQLPTQAQIEAGTATGSTSASLVLTNAGYGARYYVGYAADAGSTDAYAITLAPVPTAYFAGMIVEFKANTANTGACTLNVNSLGVKNLKVGGSDPLTGTIAANSFVLCQYDGTQFNILSVSDWVSSSATAGKIAQRNSTGDVTVNTTPTASTDAASKSYVDAATTIYKNGTTTYDISTASGTQTIAHGLGRTPKLVEIFALYPQIKQNGDGINFTYAQTIYNGTTQSSLSMVSNSTTVTASSTNFDLGVSVNTGSTDFARGVLSVDSTNITITWTKYGSPTGTVTLLWEAQG